ncbi:MAG TPA: DUF4440 domain-containing protein [Caulobacteraceae bacterium]|jgi:glutamate/tyrosine decarboxylase-like PLP-dependent enzyme
MPDKGAIRALAKRLFDAIEQGDVKTVSDRHAPAVVFWHNFDDAEQTREENLATLTGFMSRISDQPYDTRLDEYLDTTHLAAFRATI